MKFNITYRVGSSKRNKIITCSNLETAEKIATEKFTNWEDIIYVNKLNAQLAHKEDRV